MRKNEIVRAKRNQVAIVRRGRRIMHAIVSEIAWQVNELDRRTDLTHQLLAHTIIDLRISPLRDALRSRKN